MASSPDLVLYICDQLAEAGEITYRKMFGEYGIYCDKKFFACVCDDRFLVKITQAGTKLLPDCPKGLPYEGAKPYFYIENLEDREMLCKLTRLTCGELPAPKPRKKTPKKL